MGDEHGRDDGCGWRGWWLSPAGDGRLSARRAPSRQSDEDEAHPRDQSHGGEGEAQPTEMAAPALPPPARPPAAADIGKEDGIEAARLELTAGLLVVRLLVVRLPIVRVGGGGGEARRRAQVSVSVQTPPVDLTDGTRGHQDVDGAPGGDARPQVGARHVEGGHLDHLHPP